MDFGIARAMDDMGATMTQTSAVIGTAQYLSPEQARGEQVDARSDLYSTGCLLYELLTGRPPFVGDSPVSVAYQHVREEPVPPSQIDPDLPPAVDAVVLGPWPRTASSATRAPTRCAATSPRRAPAARSRRSCRRAQTTQSMSSTTVLAGTAAIPPVGSGPGAHRGGKDGRGGRVFGYTLLALAVIAVFVIAALIARSAFDGSGGSQVAVPDLTGLTVGDATSELETAEPDARPADAEGERHGARGQRHRPEPRGRHPGRRGPRGVGHRVHRRRRDRRPVPGRPVAGPGPAGAPGRGPRPSATPTSVPSDQTRNTVHQGRAPRRARPSPAGSGRPRATPAARTRCPTSSARARAPRATCSSRPASRCRTPRSRRRPTSRAGTVLSQSAGGRRDQPARLDRDDHGRHAAADAHRDADHPDRRRRHPTDTILAGPGSAVRPRVTTGARPAARASASGSPQVTSQLASSRWPPSVSTDSGWNCTPSTRQVAVPQRHDHAARGAAGDLELGRQAVLARRRASGSGWR